jgi:membrane-associated protein
MSRFIDIFLHLDTYLASVTSEYGAVAYVLLFLVIFAETGLVVTPFLPGDSLLFAAGALAALGALNPWFLVALLFIAAVLGDNVNYAIGQRFGAKAVERGSFLGLPVKKSYIELTKRYFQKYGGKIVVIARFMPIVRTFAPFVAGIGAMPYRKFMFSNLLGGALWVCIFVLGGYFFGNITVVKDNFSLVVAAIIVISVVSTGLEYFKLRSHRLDNDPLS